MSHLLNFLYHVTVPKSEEQVSEIIEVEEQGENTELKERSNFSQVLVRALKRVSCSKHLKSFFNIPLLIISNLPGLRVLKLSVEYIFFSEDKGEGKPGKFNFAIR